MIIALLNQRGAIGKTTLALHLAGEWAREKCVVPIDADLQGSLLEWSEQREGRFSPPVRRYWDCLRQAAL
jgi:chromosome partitioning protein